MFSFLSPDFDQKVGVGEMVSGKESGAGLLEKKFSFHGLLCADFLSTYTGGMARDVAKCSTWCRLS